MLPFFFLSPLLRQLAQPLYGGSSTYVGTCPIPTSVAIPGLGLFLTPALESPLAVAVAIIVDVLGRSARINVLLDIVLGIGRGLEFRVDGCDL